MFDNEYKLDNPAWYCLNETHASFAIGNDGVKRYRPDIIAFAGFAEGAENVFVQFDELIKPHESFFLIGHHPEAASNYLTESALPCLQMVCTGEIKTTNTTTITKLNEADD